MHQNKRHVKQKITRSRRDERNLTPFANKHGMNAKQLHRALQKTGRRDAPRKPDNRPKKLSRALSDDKRLLLEVPGVSPQTAALYPTPSWYTWDEKADISVIIPLYKSSSVLKDLIQSWDLKDNMKVEMILVDDDCPHNSKEEAVRLWTDRRSELKGKVGKILYNPVNQGFGVSCNIGAAHASGDILVFLNADTVVTSGWLRPIARMFKKDDVGIVGNMQLRHGGVWKDTIDSAGSEWDWGCKCFKHIGRDIYNGVVLNKALRLDNCPKDIFEVQEREMVTGCCLAIRKDVFQEVGGFNPNYRIGYWEDSELCLVVREKGYKVMYQPNSKIYHKGSHSQSASHKYARHNVNYFANKWLNSGRIDSMVAAKRPIPMKDVGNVLVRRHSAHGDVLIAGAVAAAIKKKYPQCSVMFNTDYPELFKNNPHINRTVQTHEISERQFQLYYNLDAAYEFRPFTNILEAYADVVGVDAADCELFIDQEKVDGLPDEYIAIHAGNTRWAGRNWSPMKFEIVASKLMSQGYKVVLLGANRDHLLSNDVNLMNKLNAQQLAYVIDNARLFVGIDSFPMHIAQVCETPGVCFFGSVDPKTRLVNDSIRPIQAPGLQCLGCHHRQTPPCVFTAQCEIGVQECVNEVSIPMMMKKIEEVWQTTNAS